MPRHAQHEPDDEDDWDSSDDYDPDDPETYPQGLNDDDGPALVPCRHCREEMYEDADQCSHCGMYQSAEEGTATSPSRYWIAVVLLVLFVASVMIMG
jgi:hypothetical protein